MDILLKQKKYTLKEFLIDKSIRQGIVILEGKENCHRNTKIFLYKLEQENGNTCILYNNLYSEAKISSDYDKHLFLLTICSFTIKFDKTLHCTVDKLMPDLA